MHVTVGRPGALSPSLAILAGLVDLGGQSPWEAGNEPGSLGLQV